MRILLYSLNYAPEPIGIGKYTGELAPWLAARGHEVHVVTTPPYYPAWRIGAGYRAAAWRSESADGVRVYRCPLWVPRRASGARRLAHLASFALSSLPVVVSQGLAWRPDVVGVVEPALFCAPGAWLAARLGGARVWLHIQDFEVDAAFELGLLAVGWRQRLAGVVERWLMRRFDLISTISPRMVHRLAAKGVAPRKAAYFPNWVDPDTIRPLEHTSPLRAELGLGAEAIVALYAGNIGEKQGMEKLVQVARCLRDQPDIVVVLCGEGAAAQRLAGLARGVPNLRLLPLQPPQRLNDLLNLADIHLLPQRADAGDLVMPSKLGGMLASGRPVVTGARPDTQLARAVAGCGAVVAPDDAEAMAKAVLDLARDAEERTRLGRAARAAALSDWDRERILTRFEQTLRELVE